MRYRTETRTDSERVTNTMSKSLTTTTSAPSHWKTSTLSHLPVYIMNEDQLSMYSAYMSTLGNREDLFPVPAM